MGLTLISTERLATVKRRFVTKPGVSVRYLYVDCLSSLVT